MKVGVVEILFVFVSFVIGYVLNVVLKPKHKVKIDKISHDRHVQNNSPSGVDGCSIDNFIELYHKNNNSGDILSCIGNATQYLKNVCKSRAQQDTSYGIFQYCKDKTSPPSQVHHLFQHLGHHLGQHLGHHQQRGIASFMVKIVKSIAKIVIIQEMVKSVVVIKDLNIVTNIAKRQE